MATYIPGIETYVPQVQAFTPDYKFLENVMSKRQDRYTNNYNQLNELYGKVVYADLSREDNQNIRDQYANELTPKLEQVSGLDLSLQENTNTAKALFKPFYEDKPLVRDLMFTKEYRKQGRYMDSLLNSPDEKIRKKYWDIGAKWMNYQMDDFKKADRDATLTMGNPEYVENVDLISRGIESLKEYGMNIERTTPQGDYLVTRKNGQELTRQLVGYRDVKHPETGKTESQPVYANPAYDFLEQTLLEDPAVTKAYHTKAKVEMREFSTANTDKYGSYEEAQKFWANDILTKFRGKAEEDLVEMESQLKGMESTIKSWEDYKTKKGIVPGTEEEEAYLKRIFERDILKDTFEKKQDNLKDKSAPVSTTDLLLNKAYGAQMAYEMGTDMTKAAIAYSMIDYKETMKVNPLRQDLYKHKWNMAEINQRHLNKLEQIETKAFYDAKGSGGNGVDLGFGVNGSGVEVVTNVDGTQVDEESNYINRTANSANNAKQEINTFELDHLEFGYNSSPQLENVMRGDGSAGTLSYKRAKYDSSGQFTGEYENVNKSWYDARQDLLKFENRGERSRLSNLMETTLKGTIPANGEGNADMPNDWSLIEDPGRQAEFFAQSRKLELMKMQYVNALSKTSANILEGYTLATSKPHTEKGGMRNAKGVLENYGMPPMVMPEDMYERLLLGEQYNNIKGEYDFSKIDPMDLIQLNKDDYADLGIKMLSAQKITDQINAIDMKGIKEADLPQFTAKKKTNWDPFAVLFRSIKYGDGGHKPTLLGNFWDYDRKGQVISDKAKIIAGTAGLTGSGAAAATLTAGVGLSGAGFLGTSAAIAATQPWAWPVLGAGLAVSGAAGLLGGKGPKGWHFDEEKAREYFDQYYGVQSEFIGEEIGSANNNVNAQDFNSLYRGGTHLGGEGDATQHHSYRYQYDHLNNNSKGSQITINEMKNIMSVVNGHPDTYSVLIGDKGTKAPWENYGVDGISKKKWDRKTRKGKLDQGEQKLGLDILRQALNDMQRADKTKTAPGFSLQYNPYVNVGDETMSSYTLIFDEDYSGKLDKVAGDPKNPHAKEFKESNSITVYMDTAVDNSPYKPSNQSFSPIQASIDNTGDPYSQNWPSVGSYTFYKNGNGGYSARVQPIIFDEKSGNRRLDDPFTIGIDPSATSFEALAVELEAYLYDLARQNNTSQDVFKYNFAEWQTMNEEKQPK